MSGTGVLADQLADILRVVAQWTGRLLVAEDSTRTLVLDNGSSTTGTR